MSLRAQLGALRSVRYVVEFAALRGLCGVQSCVTRDAHQMAKGSDVKSRSSRRVKMRVKSGFSFCFSLSRE